MCHVFEGIRYIPPLFSGSSSEFAANMTVINNVVATKRCGRHCVSDTFLPFTINFIFVWAKTGNGFIAAKLYVYSYLICLTNHVAVRGVLRPNLRSKMGLLGVLWTNRKGEKSSPVGCVLTCAITCRMNERYEGEWGTTMSKASFFRNSGRVTSALNGYGMFIDEGNIIYEGRIPMP